MNFIPVKRCNPYLSRRIGDVVGYIPHQYYLEVLDAVFSGTVESWSDLPSNVQDMILHAENTKRLSMEAESKTKIDALNRIDELRDQLNDMQHAIQSEKSTKIYQRLESIQSLKSTIKRLKEVVEVENV